MSMNVLAGAGRRTVRRAAGLLAASVYAATLAFVAPVVSGPMTSSLGRVALAAPDVQPGTAKGANTESAPIAQAIDPGINPRIAGIAPLDHQVYGYLPYWRLDSGTADRIDYDLLSTIALFGLGITRTGAIDTTWRGYTAYVSDDALAVTNAAHAHGVRVVPTFQLFDSGSLTKMKAFLNSATARRTFIGQALALMAQRSADGANIDFEPLPASVAPAFVTFVGEFATAMRKQFPGSTLVVATSAGAGVPLMKGLEPVVDQMFVMTYNYHWSGSTVTGPIAPLDNASRTVTRHINHFLANVPASKLIMGVPYYGYDWPVTSNAPNATVQSNSDAYGGVWSVTYASAMNWLAANPDVVRQEDTGQGSAYFTYWDPQYSTYRQVYFEDELSAAAKADFAIAKGLAGVGLWTVDYDRGFAQMWDVLRAKFYSPSHVLVPTGRVTKVRLSRGTVVATLVARTINQGNVPERGTMAWRVLDRSGKLVKKGTAKATLYPGQAIRLVVKQALGPAWRLRAGMYQLKVQFLASGTTWNAPVVHFHQPY